MLALAAVRGSADATVDSGVRDAREADATEAGGESLDDLPTELLDEVRIAGVYGEKTRSAIGAMGRFIGRHRRLQHVSVLPATVRELERTVRQFQGILLALKPFNDQWLAGPGATPDATQEDRGIIELDLRMPDEA